MESIKEFCEFQTNASSFLAKFIYNWNTRTVTPCCELSLVLAAHLIFLFTSIYGFFHLTSSSPQQTCRKWTKHALRMRLGLAVKTFVVLFVQIFVFFYSISPVVVIEYSFLSLIWIIHIALIASALKFSSQVNGCGTVCSLVITSGSFALVVYQRWRLYGVMNPRTYLMTALCSLQILNCCICVAETLMRRRTDQGAGGWNRLEDDEREIHLTVTDEDQNWIFRLFYCWTNPLINKGYRGQLKQVSDLYTLPPSLDLLRVRREFIAAQNLGDPSKFSFSRNLLRAFGFGFLFLGILRLVADVLKFMSPVLLHILIDSLQSKDSERSGLICAAAMLFAMFFSSICDFNFNFYVNKVALRVRGALLSAVYDKLLQIPKANFAQADFSSGQLVNFMSTDVDRIVNFCTSFHAFWSMPLNLAIALYLLYREIGLAFLSGLAAALVLIPINKLIANQIGKMSTKMMLMKDHRIRMVNELVRSARTLKLNVWEAFFEQKIGEIRTKELKYLKARKYLDAVCVYLWASAPVFITLAIIATYTLLMDERLTAAKIFTSMALVNILIFPLNAFPWVLNSMIEALVSKRRFDSFFAIESKDHLKTYSALNEDSDTLLKFDGDTSFYWSLDRSIVSDISLSAQKGQIIGVVGPVGSGKSTLLLGILGETICAGRRVKLGSRSIAEGVGYIAQESWLRRGTVRENILCGSAVNEDFYRRVVEACALEQDVKGMPGLDEYLIGNDGTTLSGGQRTRLALARAVYQNHEVYLLDDPFASLDHNVSRHILANCVEGLLKARGKSVVLCTHNEELLRNADWVIRLDTGGTVTAQGPPTEVLGAVPNDQQQIMASAGRSDDEDSPPIEAPEFVGAADTDEAKQEGAVKIRVYWRYVHATGYALSLAIIASLVAMQLSKNGSDIWLSKWVEANASNTVRSGVEGNQRAAVDWGYFIGPRPVTMFKDDDERADAQYYLIVYVSIATLNTILTLIRAFLFAYGGIVAAKSLHERLLKRVLNAKVSWWDSTPCGRVINRLSSDVYQVDDSLPFQLNILLASSVNLTGTLLVTVFALPIILPFVALLAILYFFIQRYYRRTTVELKRISSLTLSPLYSHLSDTVSGLISIRAHRFADRFTDILRDRLDANLRAQFASLACSQWLSVRIQLLGVLIVAAIVFGAVLQSSFSDSVNAALVGLAITYALSLTRMLNNLLCSFIDTEKELVSVERVSEYVENVPEEETDPTKRDLDKLLFCGSISGQINFVSVSLRYAPELPLAIRNVTFQVEPGQRVGIIGRTGSGKSTIFQALLRAYPIESGKVFIDGIIDALQLDPKALRSVFGYVSQAPFLFSGSIRENLCVDRVSSISDAEIHALLARADLSQTIEELGGLDAELSEGGGNLSFGERQLICLCRLVLSKPKIVLIDEATAHIDERNHLRMNELLRSLGVTVISIVHRTTGLETFDWIIEMSNGSILRQGPPSSFQNGRDE